MTAQQLDQFAAEWVAAWNSRDLERILAHYAEDVVFRSAKATKIVGTGMVEGKTALSDYWAWALESQPGLKFAIKDVFYGPDMLVIVYTNHKGVRAAETLRFRLDGKVVEASACHAAG